MDDFSDSLTKIFLKQHFKKHESSVYRVPDRLPEMPKLRNCDTPPGINPHGFFGHPCVVAARSTCGVAATTLRT